GGRESHVVGVLFEGEAQDADRLVFENPESVDDSADKTIHLLGIDALNFFEQAKIVTELFGDFDESAEILGKAASAKPKPGVEKAATDTSIHAHAVGDLLDVGAAGLANDR